MMPLRILAVLLVLLLGRNPHIRYECIQECVLWPDGRTMCTDVECDPEWVR